MAKALILAGILFLFAGVIFSFNDNLAGIALVGVACFCAILAHMALAREFYVMLLGRDK